MLEIFSTITPSYAHSEELQLALDLFKKRLPRQARLHLIERSFEESAGTALRRFLRAQPTPAPEDALFFAKEPWLFIGPDSVSILQRQLAAHSQWQCLLPADHRMEFPGLTQDYRTLWRFDRFAQSLAEREDNFLPYDGREVFAFMCRGALFHSLEPPADIFSLPRQAPTQSGISCNAYMHEPVDYYGEERTDIMHLLPEEVESILDIGCARGDFGAALKRNRVCRTAGIENNPVEGEKALTRLDQVFIGDVLEIMIQERFDCVSCLEIVEHITAPARLLERIRRDFLKPKGYLLISIPNVGHWSIIDALLAGHWDYTPIGLLCNTHVRFFTYASLCELLEEHGFILRRVETLPHPIPPDLRAVFEDMARNGREIDFANLDVVNYHILAQLQ